MSCRCSTCHLNTYSCPGHVGHIELPVPVYHVSFMPQALQLLRAKCNYCSHLRLRRVDVNRYVCRLRLVQYGLLDELQELEAMQLRSGETKADVAGAAKMDVDSSGDEDQEDDPDDLIQRRNEFVKQAIRDAGGRKRMRETGGDKVEAVAEVRRAVIKELLASFTKGKECSNCRG